MGNWKISRKLTFNKKVSNILEMIRGASRDRYASYIKDSSIQTKKNNSIMYYDSNIRKAPNFQNIALQKNKKININNTQVLKKREIIVFSQNVELPVNSSIVDY